MDTNTTHGFELRQARDATKIIICALRVYRSHLLTMLSLSVIITICVNIVAVAIGQTGTEPFSPLYAFDAALVVPLVAGYYAHVFTMIESQHHPRLSTVLSRGMRVMPNLILAEFVVVLGIGLGLLFFIVPGIVLAIRWCVVAPIVSLESRGLLGWLRSIGASARLTRTHYRHILAVMLIVLVITGTISVMSGLTIGTVSGAVAITVGLVVQSVNASVGAAVLTLLYFDLVSRQNDTAQDPLVADADMFNTVGE